MLTSEERDDSRTVRPSLESLSPKYRPGSIDRPICLCHTDTLDGRVIEQFPDDSCRLVYFVGLEEQVVKHFL